MQNYALISSLRRGSWILSQMTLLFVEIHTQFWILAGHSRPYDLTAQLSLIPGIPQLLFCILSGVLIYMLLTKFIWPGVFKHKELPGLLDNYSILPNKLLNIFDICNFVDRTTILDLHLLFLKREYTFIIYHITHIRHLLCCYSSKCSHQCIVRPGFIWGKWKSESSEIQEEEELR